VIDAPLALAFTAGLVATVNPCGFAMLPAYLSWYLGSDNHPGQDAPLATRLGRALSVGSRVSVSFLVVFGLAGLLITAGVRAFVDYVPWVALLIGAALAALGVALLAGKHLYVRLPTLRPSARIPDTRSTRSMVVFGASYAVASLSCTLPVFLAVVASTFTRTNLAAGVGTFATYALGMTAMLLAVTVSIAFAQHTLVTRLRRLARHINRIAGTLLIVAGGYIVYYWTFTLTTSPGATTGAGPARLVEAISTTVTGWIHNLGWPTIALLLAAIITGATAVALRGHRTPKRPSRDAERS
jgi:cytochrome c biogenesis protein CcdA